jgi:phage regulator Rha-like protein
MAWAERKHGKQPIQSLLSSFNVATVFDHKHRPIPEVIETYEANSAKRIGLVIVGARSPGFPTHRECRVD